jgi:hypothetical protein
VGNLLFRAALGLITAALLISAGSASAATPLAPYDGDNPFKCELQRTGTGVDYPDPGADPFCVEYDKTSQNVTDFGLVDFLTKEPARVAAAVPKCFYFQQDHWTGSVVQGMPPELWHWDGHYFFDKARGLAGAHVENLRVGGFLADPRLVPGFPAEFAPYFGPGSGGAYITLGPVDPQCAARVDTHEEQVKVYRKPWL